MIPKPNEASELQRLGGFNIFTSNSKNSLRQCPKQILRRVVLLKWSDIDEMSKRSGMDADAIIGKVCELIEAHR